MQRVLLIGSGGSGKSTLALDIGRATGLPVVHLDACYWRAGWDPMPKDEWARTVDAMLARPAWVMDGNYSGTMDARLRACDTAIFLDLPRVLCLARVVARALRHRGRTRPDMAPGCPEQITREFVSWVWRYPRDRRPSILRRLATLGPGQRAIVLRSRREVAAFVASLGPAARTAG